MKRFFYLIISSLFVLSAVLLVFSLPQCGHENFSLGAAVNTSKSCSGNMYDQHIHFLLTLFLAKLEWIFLLSAILAVISLIFFPGEFRRKNFFQERTLGGGIKKIFIFPVILFKGSIFCKLLE
ncbi:hypothetical protein C4569_02330 [Candidatus Parcubacteria bacterium]|nr:MAG: hypothetical protein C4569_02330 [Candidatus Parcubacteria bacterium]